MRKHILFLLILVLLCMNLSVANSAQSNNRAVKSSSKVKATNSLTISHLTCEYLTNPVGIGTDKPRFSWQLASETGQHDEGQQAFQILVATSENKLQADEGDVWTSGWIQSDQQTLVKFKGVSLVSNTTYFWKVKIIDRNGTTSNWSETARFSTSLLDYSLWNDSKWIDGLQGNLQSHIWFRKNFILDANPISGFINLASAGYHELYVNGSLASNYVLAPAQSRLDKRVLYLTYDIASLLKPGKNTIAIWYSSGWTLFTNYAGLVKPAIRAITNITFANGKQLQFGTNTDWKCALSCSYSTNNNNTPTLSYKDMGAEFFDRTKYIPNWNTTDFDDTTWRNAVAVSQSANVMVSSQAVEPTRIFETIRPISVKETSVAGQTANALGICFVDLGKNFSGWVRIHFKGTQANDKIKISLADDANGKDDFQQYQYYISNGGTDDVFCNRFNYLSGRYLTISGLRQIPEIQDIEGLVIGTDLRRTGSFECTNTLFNQIYETDLWTFRANLIEGFVADCPHRERLGYGEVATATSWGISLPNYASGAFYTKHLQDWIDVQQTNGYFTNSAPQMWGAGGGMWTSAGLSIAWESFQTYGDTTLLDRIYEPARRWLDFLNTFVKEGVLTRFYNKDMYFLGDWATAEGDKELGNTEAAKFFNNCVYVMNLRMFINSAKILGRFVDADLYKRRLDDLIVNINKVYYHPATGYYSNGRQVPQAFALWQNIVPDSIKQKIEKRMSLQLSVNQPYLGMGSSGLPVLMHYLTENPKHDSIVDIHLKKTNTPSYGFFIKNGETTWPEYWTGDVPSKMHTCYTGVSSWFMKSLAGIQSTSPGYKEFKISPAYNTSPEYVNATMETLYGEIKISWTKINTEYINVKITVPVGTKANVFLPNDSSVLIGSGDYEFTCKVKLVSTNIPYISEKLTLDIYPTIFENEINVKISTDKNADVKLVLRDIFGRKLMEEDVKMNNEINNYKLFCHPNLPPQIYILEVYDKNSGEIFGMRSIIKHKTQ